MAYALNIGGNRMKKILFISIAALVITFGFATSCYCMTDVNATVNSDGLMNIEISSDFGEADYVIYVLKPGFSMADITDGQTTAFAGVEEIKFPYSEESGKNSTKAVSLELDASLPKGTYTVFVGGGELKGTEVLAVYPAKDKETLASAALKEASQDSLESVLVLYQDTAWHLDMNDSTYLSSKDTVLENMYSILKDSDCKCDEVVKAYKQALVLAELKDIEQEDFYDFLFVNESTLGISYPQYLYEKDGFAEAFAYLSEEAALKTPQELEKLLEQSEALAKLNASTRETIIDTLKAYNNIFMLDFDGSFKDVDEYSLSKVLFSKIPFKSISGVIDDFDREIYNLSVKEESSGGKTGGGSSTVKGGKNASYSGYDNSLTGEMLKQVDAIAETDDLNEAEWAKPYIQYLVTNKIMSGDGNGKFRPNDFIKKEELLKLICETLKIEGNEEQVQSFEDVDVNLWYADYVKKAVQNGIVNGKDEKHFGTGEAISRQDAAVMVYRAVKNCGKELQKAQNQPKLGDEEQISDYAADAVVYLTECGIINGNENGEFMPKKSITRAEAAKIIYSIIKAIIS